MQYFIGGRYTSKKDCLITVGVLLVLLTGLALADDAVMEQLGARAANAAIDELSFQKGDLNVLALTTAGYAIAGNDSTIKAVKGITNVSGCELGDGNLFRILRPHWKPLWFFFYNKTSGDAIFLEVNSSVFGKSADEVASLSDDQVFSTISNANINLDYMLNHTDEGNKTFNEKVFSGNEFSIIGFANVWADPNATFDFMQATAFHDHLCPGVTSGYMIAKYVENVLPITDISNQSYKVISCPNWCKDDALQILWDATPGKSGMFVMALTTTEKDALRAKYKADVAGIYIRWNSSSNSGDALVLGFNWTTANAMTGTDVWTGPSWASKIVSDVRLMKFWNTPEAFVTTIKEFQVDADKLAQLENAGMHPLKVAGVL